MGISLDLYDFFAHLVPGGFFLMAFLYGFQETWLRSAAFSELTTAQLIGLAVFSYILGYVIDPIGYRWYRMFRGNLPKFGLSTRAVEQLSKHHPNVVIDTQAMSWYVLLAYIKRENLAMAREIERFNVTHIMLRSISLGCLVFAFVFSSKIITTQSASLPVILSHVLLSLLSMGASYLLMQEAIKFRRWFYQSIYQSTLALKLTPENLPVATGLNKAHRNNAYVSDAVIRKTSQVGGNTRLKSTINH